ncbi:MAG: hypothetical protein ACFFG0_08020 [Candidatus Thorarchaeota archaeon]
MKISIEKIKLSNGNMNLMIFILGIISGSIIAIFIMLSFFVDNIFIWFIFISLIPAKIISLIFDPITIEDDLLKKSLKNLSIGTSVSIYTKDEINETDVVKTHVEIVEIKSYNRYIGKIDDELIEFTNSDISDIFEPECNHCKKVMDECILENKGGE